METADVVSAPRCSAIVEVEGVWKAYGAQGSRVSVLSGVDMKVRFGEMVALSGPSGSGKSTLLNILGCLDRPTSGRYHLGGTEVSRLTREEQAWVRLHYVGFVFQSFHLLAQATTLENAALPLHYAGLPRWQCERRARSLLERVGLRSRLDHFPNQLSGGERQRVAIARALIGNPRLLLADEPTGSLDSKAGGEIMELLLELHRERRTSMIVVTHDPRVAAFANRRVRLFDGTIVDDEVSEDASLP